MSIRACEACGVGANPTLLTNFPRTIPRASDSIFRKVDWMGGSQGKVIEPSVCKTDLPGVSPGCASIFSDFGLQALQRCSGLLNRRARGGTVAAHHLNSSLAEQLMHSFCKRV